MSLNICPMMKWLRDSFSARSFEVVVLPEPGSPEIAIVMFFIEVEEKEFI